MTQCICLSFYPLGSFQYTQDLATDPAAAETTAVSKQDLLKRCPGAIWLLHLLAALARALFALMVDVFFKG